MCQLWENSVENGNLGIFSSFKIKFCFQWAIKEAGISTHISYRHCISDGGGFQFC